MCGIVGVIGDNVSSSHLSSMAAKLSHRGPDDTGIWKSPKSNIGFGHARLAIQDLSSFGFQPMVSRSGRFVMVFNGEIYNHVELRAALERSKNHTWKGHSDTETLLVAFETWGIFEAIAKVSGMFAIALWDLNLQRLALIRDRFGEKPLYYGRQNNTFMFSSELKSLKIHPDFEGVIDRQALSQYFRLNYIPTPLSIYQDIFKLEPGVIVTFDENGYELSKEAFWSLEDEYAEGPGLDNCDDSLYIDELEHLIKKSVAAQMIGDVPLGAFLSGGVDSSTIVAILQEMSDKPVCTFTIGFDDPQFNESKDAKLVADYLGTNHHEFMISSNEAIEIITELPNIYDEPFSDSSQIPTILVSRLAKNVVTVCLSGDGGDELFCGYNRYQFGVNVWSFASKIPLSARVLLGKLLLSVTPLWLDKIGKFTLLDRLYPNLGNKVQKIAVALKANSIEDLYMRLVSNWSVDDLLVKNSEPKTPPLLSRLERLKNLEDVEKMMLWDMQSYLMDDVLVKTDRATMASSLEARVPLIDPQITKFSAMLPTSLKIRKGKGKWILRQVLFRYVPKELIERPKKGFSVPVSDWLRGPLKDWAEGLLDANLIEKQGYLDSALIQSRWSEHIKDKRDWGAQIWSVLMFQLWLEENHLK